jgi:hypothetical protein
VVLASSGYGRPGSDGVRVLARVVSPSYYFSKRDFEVADRRFYVWRALSMDRRRFSSGGVRRRTALPPHGAAHSAYGNRSPIDSAGSASLAFPSRASPALRSPRPYHAVKRSIHLLGPGSTAVVIGAGGLGQMAIQVLKALSAAATVIAVDTSRQARNRQEDGRRRSAGLGQQCRQADQGHHPRTGRQSRSRHGRCEADAGNGKRRSRGCSGT